MRLPYEVKELVHDMEYDCDKQSRAGTHVIRWYDNNKAYYLKMNQNTCEVLREHNMYRWLGAKLPLPEVVYEGMEDGKRYLLIQEVKGTILAKGNYLDEPERVVRLAASGILMLQSLQIDNCPYYSDIDSKIEKAKERLQLGLVKEVTKNEYTEEFDDFEEMLEYLEHNKPEEEFVFSHGDYCFNNYFSDGEKITGFIDLGRAGIADRYQDIATCVRDLMRYDPSYTVLFFELLGLEPDYEKLKYFIVLDEFF